jgi:hypothetical protein
LSQTSFLVRLSSLFASFILVTPNAIPAPRIGLQTSQTAAASPVTLQAALAALSPNIAITDVTLAGSAHYIAGSDDETGSVILKALSSGPARSDLSLSSGTFSEIFNLSSSGPAGAWSGSDGIFHAAATHNLLTEPAWFSPNLAIARRLSSPTFVATYVGRENLNGQTVEHVAVCQTSAYQDPPGGPTFAHLSQVDFYIDSGNFLLAAMAFNVHPDDDAILDIPVQIRFSDYRSVSGVQVPFRVQKMLNNMLFLDLQLQVVTINSGVSISSFNYQ